MNSRSLRRSTGRSVRNVFFTLTVLGGVAACSSGTEPDSKPTEARIRVEGTSTVPLQLLTSLDFFETVDPISGEIRQILNTADTVFVDALPYDATVPLTSLGSIYVELANLEDTPANVRLQVDLDNGQGYDRSATMSEGGALVYAYVFLQTII